MASELAPSHLFDAVRAAGLRRTLSERAHVAHVVAHGLQQLGVHDAVARHLHMRAVFNTPDPSSPSGYSVAYVKETDADIVSWNGGREAWVDLRKLRTQDFPKTLADAAIVDVCDRLWLNEEQTQTAASGTWVVLESAGLFVKGKPWDRPSPKKTKPQVEKARVLACEKIERAKAMFPDHLRQAMAKPGRGTFFALKNPELPAETLGNGWDFGLGSVQQLDFHLRLDAAPPADAWATPAFGNEGLWVHAKSNASTDLGQRVLVVGGSSDTQDLLRRARLHTRLVDVLPPPSNTPRPRL